MATRNQATEHKRSHTGALKKTPVVKSAKASNKTDPDKAATQKKSKRMGSQNGVSAFDRAVLAQKFNEIKEMAMHPKEILPKIEVLMKRLEAILSKIEEKIIKKVT